MIEEICCLRANEEVVVSLPRKMKTKLFKREVLLIISNCDVDLVVAILVFVLASMIHWTEAIYLVWLLHDSAKATIISVPE